MIHFVQVGFVESGSMNETHGGHPCDDSRDFQRVTFGVPYARSPREMARTTRGERA
jgi:hypothetical protein